MGLLPLYFLFLFLSVSSGEISNFVGVNYGQLGNNLPSPKQSVKLVQSLGAKRVKIYDANPSILDAFKDTNIQVSMMVPNELIINISNSQKLADSWVESNVVPFYPKTKIRYLLVGNEVISGSPKEIWPRIVPAMRKIRNSLKTHSLNKIKVATSMAMDMLESSFPPSNGTFRSDIADPIVKPLLQFLNRTKSFYFLDVYPYFAWANDPKSINLDYALFESRNITYTDPDSRLTYTNLFDQMVDSVVFAMKRLGYPDVRIFIAETGWPNAGDIDQIGANIYNAATYNRNIVKKLTAKPAIGTPARPGWVIPSLIFALYNENQKTGPGTERHFGLLNPNGSYVYGIDLSGKTPVSDFEPLPKPDNNEPYKGKIWCVAARGANATALSAALSYACSQGNTTCDPIQPGKQCFKPDSLYWHASYAFSSYWSQLKKAGGSCYFNGLATQTAKDPSTDVAGEIVQVGPGVNNFKAGDKVVAVLGNGGALAEFAVAHSSSTVPRPPEVSAADGAALPIAGLAAHQSLTKLAGLKLDGSGPPVNVLITAASGGVGTYAVQLAKLANAHVTATCGARNMDLIRSLGADEVLDYKTQEGTALKSPSGRKYDVIIHCTANIPWSTFEANLTPKGKVVDTTPGFGTLLSVAVKKITFANKQLLPLFTAVKQENLDYLVKLAQAGKLKSVIDSTHPLSKAEEAWAKSIEGHATGKILVEP